MDPICLIDIEKKVSVVSIQHADALWIRWNFAQVLPDPEPSEGAPASAVTAVMACRVGTQNGLLLELFLPHPPPPQHISINSFSMAAFIDKLAAMENTPKKFIL